jgi:hypothetical protein
MVVHCIDIVCGKWIYITVSSTLSGLYVISVADVCTELIRRFSSLTLYKSAHKMAHFIDIRAPQSSVQFMLIP